MMAIKQKLFDNQLSFGQERINNISNVLSFTESLQIKFEKSRAHLAGLKTNFAAFVFENNSFENFLYLL